MMPLRQDQKTMTNFDYKNYSLDNLSNWLHDSMSSGEATPQEIYDTIIGVVKENYDCYKKQADQAEELLNLLNNGWTKEDVLKESQYSNPLTDVIQPQYVNGWNVNTLGVSTIGDFTVGNSVIDFSNLTYTTKEELNNPTLDGVTFSSCSADDTTPECITSWSDFWGTNDVVDFTHVTEDGDIYTNKSVKVDGYSVDGVSHSKYWYDYDRNDPNRKNPFEDKVVTWRLPVEIDSVSGEYYFTLPEDLLERTGWKENDSLHWVDNGDGSFTLQKVEKSEETKL